MKYGPTTETAGAFRLPFRTGGFVLKQQRKGSLQSSHKFVSGLTGFSRL